MSDAEYAGFKTVAEIQTWEKVYWYLRILINSDRYGGIGQSSTVRNKHLLEDISVQLRDTYTELAHDPGMTDAEKKNILEGILAKILFSAYPPSVPEPTSRAEKTKRNQHEVATELHARLAQFFILPIDYFILAFTITELLLPINAAMDEAPVNEPTELAKTFAKDILDREKEQGLATLIRKWDSMTEDLALNKERDIAVALFERVMKTLGTPTLTGDGFTESDGYAVLTALVQEYERRLGQKRKSRAGRDLEGAAEYIFKYFGVKTHGGPAHFNVAIEVDNWFKDSDGWFVGVSLKRTLRERWKQTDVGADTLTQYKIKNIIHVINNDKDLSIEKIRTLGASRHLLFIADESPILRSYGAHAVVGKYLFPMSQLIEKINELISN